MDPWYGYLILIFSVMAQPSAQLMLKFSSLKIIKDQEFVILCFSVSAQAFYNFAGLFIYIAIAPILHLLSYYFIDNSIVAPSHSASVLFGIGFAWLFVPKERAVMNSLTFLGAIIYTIGLTMILVSYTRHTEDERHNIISWEMLIFYYGIWIFSVTLATLIGSSSQNVLINLFCWSGAAGILSSLDIVSSVDKWVYSEEIDNSIEVARAVLASLSYAIAGLAAIIVLNYILKDPAYDLHVVAPIYASFNLIYDVLADLLVFTRYESWVGWDYATSVSGLTLMIAGIILLNKVASNPKSGTKYIPLERSRSQKSSPLPARSLNKLKLLRRVQNHLKERVQV